MDAAGQLRTPSIRGMTYTGKLPNGMFPIAASKKSPRKCSIFERLAMDVGIPGVGLAAIRAVMSQAPRLCVWCLNIRLRISRRNDPHPLTAQGRGRQPGSQTSMAVQIAWITSGECNVRRRGGPRRRKFLGRENFLQFVAVPLQSREGLGLKCAWHRAPAAVVNEG